LLPGQSKNFVFGQFTPISPVAVGSYPFYIQMQIFAATTDRPMIDFAWPGISANRAFDYRPASCHELLWRTQAAKPD
jgi:hypothetical protein